jgi:predicted nuclease with TOPRIM domain
MEKS